MADYVGMKSILANFWKTIKSKGDAKFAEKTDVETLDTALAVLDAKVDAKISFEYQITDTIPEATKENMGKIWLVPKGEGKTGYKEYIVVKTGDNTYSTEEIGDTDVDLTGYVKTINSVAVDTGTTNVTLTASNINDDSNNTVQEVLDDHALRLLGIENSELNIKVNGVDATITKDTETQDISATVTITSSNIAISSTDTTTVESKFIGLSTQLAGYQIALTDTQLSAVNSGITSEKVATYDTVASDYLKSSDLTLTDKDFEDIFTEES